MNNNSNGNDSVTPVAKIIHSGSSMETKSRSTLTLTPLLLQENKQLMSHPNSIYPTKEFPSAPSPTEEEKKEAEEEEEQEEQDSSNAEIDNDFKCMDCGKREGSPCKT